MDIRAIATEFTEALKQGDYDKAESFWADDVVSLEAMDGPMSEVRGKEAVHGKGEWWNNNNEIHSFSVEGPYVHGDQFSLAMEMDVTSKETGQREQMKEVGLYSVKDGKITEERFFY